MQIRVLTNTGLSVGCFSMHRGGGQLQKVRAEEMSQNVKNRLASYDRHTTAVLVHSSSCPNITSVPGFLLGDGLETTY